MIAGDNSLQPVGCPWTTPCTGCGSFCCPQPVEITRPRIHNRLTWLDPPSPGSPVDGVGTTSQSPGCGREKVAESVERGRNQAINRTAVMDRGRRHGQSEAAPAGTEGSRSTAMGAAEDAGTGGGGPAAPSRPTSDGLVHDVGPPAPAPEGPHSAVKVLAQGHSGPGPDPGPGPDGPGPAHDEGRLRISSGGALDASWSALSPP